MEEIAAGRFAKLARLCGWLQSFDLNDKTVDRQSVVPASARETHAELIEESLPSCEQLGLRLTVVTMNKILRMFREEAMTYAGYFFLINELDGRLTDEMEDKFLFSIEPERAKYYADLWPYGNEVEWQFPTTVQDIEEASKCLALGRDTASVYHATRVLEVGLYALGRYLGVEAIEVNWEEAIRKIESAITQLNNNGPGRNGDADARALWEKKKQFCSDAATQFRYFKDGWRNRAAHAGYMYSDEKALQIFTSVGDFMKTLTEHFNEVGYDATWTPEQQAAMSADEDGDAARER